MSMILISHDIGLIAEMSDRVAVMYAGQIVEEADVFTLFAHPMHPYTRLLIAATPGLQGDPKVPLQAIPGAVPVDYPNMKGCRFAPRCPWRSKVCTLPQMMRRFTGDHLVRCGMIMDKESTLS